jgi:hypothetical protein
MDNTTSVEFQTLDLERQRLGQEKELKSKELEVNRELKLRELAVQERQLVKGQWSGPFGAAVLAGILGLIGTCYGTWESRRLERQKQEGTVILEAIRTAGSATEKDRLTAKNLVFLADAGLISSIPGDRLKKLREQAGPDPVPSLPTSAPVIGEQPGDNFRGLERAAAKLSVADVKLETFGDLHALIASLTPDAAMKAHQPPISHDADSDRVVEERRTVRVHAFVYAASKQADNDFKLIVGRAPNLTPAEYMVFEVGGLPPSKASSFSILKAARDSFKAFFEVLPGYGYTFYDPPIPVDIEGSLFFDTIGASMPETRFMRLSTVWEVHPVSKITFACSEAEPCPGTMF